MEIPEKILFDFLNACLRIAEHGLLLCSSGNLSCRLDADHILITATRSWLANITADQVAVLRLSDGAAMNAARPSGESRFHLGILRERPDVNVVLHFQSPAATTLACGRPDQINFFVIPEIPYYIGRIAIIPYIDPGSEDLATAVTSAMKNHNLAMLTQHGQVTVGVDFNDVIQKAAFFELACDIILRGGERVLPLSDEAVNKLLAHLSGQMKI